MNDKHTHPSAAHRAACPVCNPNKTVPQLNDDYRTEEQESVRELWRRLTESIKRLREHMQSTGGDLFVSIKILGSGRLCGDHLNYRGVRPPKGNCKGCHEVYEDRQHRRSQVSIREHN